MADSTINGLTALIGSDVDQTADQFALWDNSAATTKKITRTNVMNGPLVGDVGSAVRAAADSYGGVAFDGATSGTRITSALTGQNIGTGDMSMWNRLRVFTTTGTTRYIAALSSSSTSADQARACLLYINSIGGLVVYLYGATGADSRSANISGFQSAHSGQVVDIVITRTGATLKIYINGIDTAYTELTSGTPPAWSDTITSTNLLIGQSSGTSNIFSDRIYRAVLFNRALSASDVAELSISGVNPADQFGTQTAAYTSDFSSGADGWQFFVRSAVAGNVDGILGVDDTLRIIPDVGSNTHYTYNAAVPGVVAGKRYRIGFSYYIPAANAVANGIQILQNGVAYSATGVFNATGAWTNAAPSEFVAVGTRVELVPVSSGNTVFNGNGTDAIYLKSISFTRIGAIVDLDLGSGIGYQSHDRSTNRLHGTLFGGTSWTSQKKSGTVYGATSTNGNQQLLASASIPADATITSIAVNSNGGTPNVTIGNASGGTQLLGSTALTGVSRQILTPTLPISTTGNLWINSTSTATLNWSINYTTSF